MSGSAYQCGVCYGWHTHAGDCAGPSFVFLTSVAEPLAQQPTDENARLRAQLAQRDEELTALREKVRAVYELVTLFDYTAIYDLKCDLLAALSDNQEGRKSGTVPVYGHGVVLAEDGDTLWFLSDSGSHWSVRRDVMTWENKEA